MRKGGEEMKIIEVYGQFAVFRDAGSIINDRIGQSSYPWILFVKLSKDLLYYFQAQAMFASPANELQGYMGVLKSSSDREIKQ